MGEDSGGGKSTLVQAPQKSSAPLQTGTRSGGFVKSAKKKKHTTAGDVVKDMFRKASPAAKSSYGYVDKNPYPQLLRNDKCGCGSGKKYKICCLR